MSLNHKRLPSVPFLSLSLKLTFRYKPCLGGGAGGRWWGWGLIGSVYVMVGVSSSSVFLLLVVLSYSERFILSSLRE